MPKKRVTSRPGLFGYVYHYDENGRCIGKSRPGLLGNTKVHFNSEGKKVGTARPGFLAKEVFRDEENNVYISSYDGMGGNVHYSSGRSVGTTKPGFFGSSHTVREETDEWMEGDLQFDDESLSECENEHKSVPVEIILVSIFCLIAFILCIAVFT